MKKKPSHHPVSRLSALITALLILLVPMTALGQRPQPVTFTLAYTDSQGNPQQLQAMPVSYEGYATSFWLYLDPQAQADPAANLLIQDVLASTRAAFPPPAAPLKPAVLYGRGERAERPAPGGAGLWPGRPGPGHLLPVHQPLRPAAQSPSPEVSPATITIHYVDQLGQEFDTEQRTLDPGPHTVAPDPAKVPEGYTLTSQGDFPVTVNEFGANPSDITFTYQKAIAPATVNIHYVDQNMQEFASEQRGVPRRPAHGDAGRE